MFNQSRFTSRKRRNKKHFQPRTQNSLGYENLEPRQLLAGLINSSVATGVDGPRSLYFSINAPTPANQQMDVLREHLQLGDNETLHLTNTYQDQLGYTHFYYQQHYNGVPVDATLYKAHVKDDLLVGVSGDFVRVEGLTTAPHLTSQTAFEIATEFVDAQSYVWQLPDFADQTAQQHLENLYGADFRELPNGELTISNLFTEQPQLAYKFDLYSIEPYDRQNVFVDAMNGEILGSYSTLNHVDAPATGLTNYEGLVGFTADNNGTEYTLSASTHVTWDLNGSTQLEDANEINSPSSFFADDEIGVQVHYGVEQTLDYFQVDHGLNGFDNNGALVQAYTSFSTGYGNAFWNGSVLVFGDGDGVRTGPFGSLDVVGHEFAHAVNQNFNQLVSFRESGAISESFSDIFGEAVENHSRGYVDWLVAADVTLDGNGGRAFAEPKDLFLPDTYLGQYWYDGVEDFGGIHVNGTVANKWFFLLAEGGSGINDGNVEYDIEGIGIDDAAAIAFRSFTVYMTPQAQFVDARQASIQAAVDLYGNDSVQHLTTISAWNAVGVYNPDISFVRSFANQGALGSMAFRETIFDSFTLGFDDTFIVPLDPYQTMSVSVQGLGNLQPAVSILGPDGTFLDGAESQTSLAFFQSIPIVEGGFYFIVVDGNDDTSGAYQLDILLNADFEVEELTGEDNDELVDAQAIGNSRLPFLTPLQNHVVDRLSVNGSLASEPLINTEIIGNDFEGQEFGPEWTLNSTGAGRTRITDLWGAAGGSYAMVMDTLSGYALNEAILTINLLGVANPSLQFSYAEWGDEAHNLPATFTGSYEGDGVAVSPDGVNWYTILTNANTANGVWLDFNLNLGEFAAENGFNIGQEFQIKFQQYDNFPTDSDGRGFDNIQVSSTQPSDDWYWFDVADGVHATAVVSPSTPTGTVQLELFDPQGNRLQEGVRYDNAGSAVANFVGYGGAFFARVSGDTDYNLDVMRGTTFDLEPNDASPQPLDDFHGAFGHIVNLDTIGAEPDDATHGTVIDSWFIGVTLSNHQTDENVLALETPNYAAPTGNMVFGFEDTLGGRLWMEGFNELRADFDEPQFFVSIDVGSDDEQDLGWLRAYDANGFLLEQVQSGSIASGQSETISITRPQADIAYVIASGFPGQATPLDNLVFEANIFDSDTYSLDLNSGDELTLFTYIPGGGPFFFDNRLLTPTASNLFVELLHPNGNSLIIDNWTIEYNATLSGTYTINVYAQDSVGEYAMFHEVISDTVVVPTSFDFGPLGSDVYEDYTPVFDDVYDAAVGYGWQSLNNLIGVQQNRGDNLTRDKLSLTTGMFAVDIANGMYEIDVVLGVVKKLDAVSITVEGVEDTFTPRQGPYVVRSYLATVTDGQINLEFDGLAGLSRRIVLSGLNITPVQGRSASSGSEDDSNRASNVSALIRRVERPDNNEWLGRSHFEGFGLETISGQQASDLSGSIHFDDDWQTARLDNVNNGLWTDPKEDERIAIAELVSIGEEFLLIE